MSVMTHTPMACAASQALCLQY